MKYQKSFKRYELKYMISKEEKNKLMPLLEQYMDPCKFRTSQIRNVYYDTPSFQLIRNSLEKPMYKEKLRIRSYKDVETDKDEIFVEIKKKYDSVVYKRRLSMPMNSALEWLDGNLALKPDSQIGNEIECFVERYDSLTPSMFVSYDRESFQGKEDKDFRVTFDTNISAEKGVVSLAIPEHVTRLIDEGHVLMEVKTATSIPMWMARFLSEEKIFKKSFSKYGTAYKELVL